MTATITNYLIESGISLGIFTSIYLVFLRKETYFQLNRIFLLAALLFSLLLPFLHIPLSTPAGSFLLGEVTVTADRYQNLLQTVTVYGTRITGVVEQTVSHFGLIRYAYVSGVLLFSSLFIFRLVQLLMMVFSNETIRKERIILVRTGLDMTPFSFFNLLFINRNSENKDGMKEMLAHEMEHVRQAHSIDVVLMEMVAILQWFNPFVWLLKRSLRENHEFLADHGALKQGASSASYRLLLLNTIVGQQPVIANNFNYSMIKNRIQMITRIKSSKTASLKLTLGLVATMALLIFFAPSPLSANASFNPSAKGSSGFQEEKEKIYNNVEQMPEYPGGEQAMTQYIIKEVKYPDDAKKAGKQGKVYVTFVVNKDGKVTGAKIAKGADPSLDKEALRVIGGMPQWKPGKEKGKNVAVQFTLPITFALK